MGVTLGITAQSPPRALIDKGVYDLDVGSGHPNGAAAIKGSFVQRLTVLRDLSSDRSNPGQFLSTYRSFLVRKDRKEEASVNDTPHPLLMNTNKIEGGQTPTPKSRERRKKKKKKKKKS